MEILVVGMGFGAAFLPIYQAHPDVTRVGAVDPDPGALTRAVEAGVHPDDCFRRLEDALATDRWDAVHVLAPVSWHVEQTLAVLGSGRHCACAVPMATELADIDRLVEGVERSGRRYMMMETSLFSNEFFLARRVLDDGTLGRITHYRGEHLQNLDGYPSYWLGYPPMRYLTHALSPALGLTGGRVRSVSCRGSSRLTPEHVGSHGPGWAVQTGLFAIESTDERVDRDLTATITTSFFQLGRGFYEGFSVYGDEGSLEWPQVWDGPMTLWRLRQHVPGDRGRHGEPESIEPPAFTDGLPESLHRFTRGDHGGSHPHLAHEFVRCVVEDRPSLVDARRAAELVAPGICADASSHAGGRWVDVPDYR